MASFSRLPSGKWRAAVFKRGIRQTQAFDTKAAAVAWATRIEAEIEAKQRGQIIRRTLRQAFERYKEQAFNTRHDVRHRRRHPDPLPARKRVHQRAAQL